jgi:UPF0042 nucleotide-binding protein
MNYYCVDNLPPLLLPILISQLKSTQAKVAISLDARNVNEQEKNLPEVINRLKQEKKCRIIYLDADDRTLVRRFKETRRKHPLSSETVSLNDALKEESRLLLPILETVDFRVDTSSLKPQQLRSTVLDYIGASDANHISILLESFGYKYGMPYEADLVFDVRCLPNPYWNEALRNHTGKEPQVIEFLQQHGSCQQMLEDIHNFVSKWIPAYEAEQKKYLTVAVGCTGGMHRSVYITEQLHQLLKDKANPVSIKHRELS